MQFIVDKLENFASSSKYSCCWPPIFRLWIKTCYLQVLMSAKSLAVPYLSALSQHNPNTFLYVLYLQQMNTHQWRTGGNMISVFGVFVATIVGRLVLKKSSAVLLLPPNTMSSSQHHQLKYCWYEYSLHQLLTIVFENAIKICHPLADICTEDIIYFASCYGNCLLFL